MKFAARGREALKKEGMGFEVSQIMGLSDLEREAMCVGLLEEFGAKNVTVKGDEIVHSCCLPFGLHAHGDRNPSASLNFKKLVYHCYGCGSGGGIVWFLSVCRGEDVEGVKTWLKKREESVDSYQNLIQYFDYVYTPGETQVAQPLPKFNPAVLDPWRLIHPYLTEIRHIPEANIIRQNVGFDPKTVRIVLPHFWEGDLVGWQTRRLADDGTPKYKNTPDFPKDLTIYNKPTSPSEIPLVVESVMSVVSKIHLNKALCATFGASVTRRQCMLLAEHPRVTLWFDNDEAGWKATSEVAEILKPYCEVYVVESEWAADPADLDDETYKTTYCQQVPYVIWRPPTTLKEWKT